MNPLAGRIIDYERYYSPVHGEDRHALIIAAYPGPVNGWALWRNNSKPDFVDRLQSPAE